MSNSTLLLLNCLSIVERSKSVIVLAQSPTPLCLCVYARVCTRMYMCVRMLECMPVACIRAFVFFAQSHSLANRVLVLTQR